MCLLDFPTEILLKIFNYLESSDRKVAATVCSRLNNIWLDSKFDGDRRLVFKHCLIKNNVSPYNIFIKTRKQYKHLILSDISLKGETNELWKIFGRSVTYLELLSIIPHCALKHFTEITELVIKDEHLMENRLPSNIAKTVEVLKITFTNFHDSPDTYLNLIRFFPSLKSLKLKFERTYETITTFLDLYKETLTTFLDLHKSKITELDVYLFEISGISGVIMPELTHLSIKIDSEVDLNELAELLDSFPKLEYLKLHVEDIEYPYRNLNCLKSLTVKNGDAEGIHFLILSLTDLEELRISLNNYSGQRCFFTHKVIVNSNLKKLHINMIEQQNCLKCYQTLMECFPNVIEFETEIRLTQKYSKITCENFKKLSTLKAHTYHRSFHWSFDSDCYPTQRIPLKLTHLECVTHFSNLTELGLEQFLITKAVAQNWPIMPNLKKVTINQISKNLSITDFLNIIKHLPILEYILFYSSLSQEMVFAIANNCKRLKSFIVNDDDNNRSFAFQELERILQNCEYMQEIDVPSMQP